MIINTHTQIKSQPVALQASMHVVVHRPQTTYQYLHVGGANASRFRVCKLNQPSRIFYYVLVLFFQKIIIIDHPPHGPHCVHVLMIPIVRKARVNVLCSSFLLQ